MIMARSRPCDGADDTTCEAAELGVEVTGQHTKLMKSIGVWEKVASKLDIRVIGAVKIESSTGKEAIDRKLRACTRSYWRIGNVVRYARNCLNEVVCIPAVQWKVLNAFLVYGVTDLRFTGVDKCSLCLDGYVLLDRARLKPEADLYILVCIQADVFLRLRLVTRHLDEDFVVTGVENREVIFSRYISRRHFGR